MERTTTGEHAQCTPKTAVHVYACLSYGDREGILLSANKQNLLFSMRMSATAFCERSAARMSEDVRIQLQAQPSRVLTCPILEVLLKA